MEVRAELVLVHPFTKNRCSVRRSHEKRFLKAPDGPFAPKSFILLQDLQLLLYGVDPSTQLGKSPKGRPMKKIVGSLDLLASWRACMHAIEFTKHLQIDQSDVAACTWPPVQPESVQKKQRRRATSSYHVEVADRPAEPLPPGPVALHDLAKPSHRLDGRTTYDNGMTKGSEDVVDEDVQRPYGLTRTQVLVVYCRPIIRLGLYSVLIRSSSLNPRPLAGDMGA